MSDENEGQSVKYPNCVVRLGGEDGNAVAIFRTVRKELIRHLTEKKWSREDAVKEGDAYQEEATSGDYQHVWNTTYRWVTVA